MLLLLLACGPGDTDDTAYSPVSNAAPLIIELELEPQPNFAADGVSAILDVLDTDGDEIRTTVTWELDGVELGVDGLELPPFTAVRDQLVKLTVTLSDGFAFGEPGFAELIVENTAPVVDEVLLDPEKPGIEDDVRCVPTAHDDDGETPKMIYTWYVDGVASTTETGEVHPQGLNDGQTIQCEVVADDLTLQSEPVRSEQVYVGNSPPQEPGIALDPDPPNPCTEGEVVVTEESYDADGDAVSYRGIWTDASGNTVHEGMQYGEGTFEANASYSVEVVPYDAINDGVSTSLAFQATVGGERVGNGLDDDCDGVVDEWLDQAYQAQQLWWDDTESAQAGVTLEAGDLDGDGLANLILARAGTADIVVFMGRNMDPDAPRLYAPDATVTGASGTQSIAMGDVDGDGRSELAVAAPAHDTSRANVGAVFLLAGSTPGDGELEDLAIWTRMGTATDQGYGDTVALGDLDGDGLADFVVGDAQVSAPSLESGRVEVYLGASSTEPDFVLEGTNRQVELGHSIRVVPDIDGDGVGELAAGGPGDDSGGADAGIMAIWSGATLSSSAVADADIRLVGGENLEGVGAEGPGAGDLDGDGATDLAIAGAGRIGLFLAADIGAGGTYSLDDAWAEISGSASLGADGRGPALGDVDGDGDADLLAGDGTYGELWLWTGITGSATVDESAIYVVGEQSGDQFGRHNGLADTDGDGTMDLYVSAYRNEVAASRGGAAYLFRPGFGVAAQPGEPLCETYEDRLYCRDLKSWDDARVACQVLGRDLARIEDSTAAAESTERATDRAKPGTERGGWWIGLNQRSGDWAWLDESTAAKFTEWANGSPQTGAGDCVALNATRSGEWANRACSGERFYICQ